MFNLNYVAHDVHVHFQWTCEYQLHLAIRVDKAILTEGPLAEVFPSFCFECHADYFPLSTSTVHWQLSFEKDGVISLKGPEEASLSAKDIWSAELLLMYFSDKSKCWLFLTGLNVISVLFSDHIKKIVVCASEPKFKLVSLTAAAAFHSLNLQTHSSEHR